VFRRGVRVKGGSVIGGPWPVAFPAVVLCFWNSGSLWALFEIRARFAHRIGPLVACSVLEYNVVSLSEKGKSHGVSYLAMNRRRWLWFFLVGTGLVELLMTRYAPGDPAVTPTPTKTQVALALATSTATSHLPPAVSPTVILPSPTPLPPLVSQRSPTRAHHLYDCELVYIPQLEYDILRSTGTQYLV
jgi:hypothetical protein